ncbi:MAG: serine/threonine protein kinase [Rhodospirillales bacterium]|nr:serine/threonine protein kinase [Rhodospirillales bacterium]MCB9994866.1 serine/threonine protein kinase [Rhodospirillales bacterium]
MGKPKTSEQTETISLNKQAWEIDTSSPLGRAGGFGEVFHGRGPDGSVAIKRLKITAGEAAHREMNIGNDLSSKEYDHVVPILDSGLDANSDRYYLVMPVCDGSLQDEINSRKEPFEAEEVIGILLEILTGLEEVSHITHRDLKPANVLSHHNKWKLADFGIAKFVEDSTSLETLRTSLTPAYAAPEQWLLERPSAATDIYAAGCIAHTLITGAPPFDGDFDTVREKHLHETPASLSALPASVRSLVSIMLRKSPETRPSRKRCIEVLQRSLASGEKAGANQRNNLMEAVNAIAVTQAQQEAAENAEKERVRRRDNIFNEAVSDLKRIKDRLFQEIFDHARDVIGNDERQLQLPRMTIGKASLVFDTTVTSHSTRGICKSDPQGWGGGDGGWGVHKKASDWDIVAFTHIGIEQHNGPRSYLRSANLIYAKPKGADDYRWYELSFFSIGTGSRKSEPYCLDYVWEIDKTLSAMDINQHAHPPTPIDGEDEDNFIAYWIDVVSQAATGNLVRPSRLPIER